MSDNVEEVHVVMLPWSAFGHLIPFLNLSVALARSGIHVSYISTPRNIQRLPKVPPALSPLIDFISIPLPRLSSNPLPENAEATTDIPVEKIDSLKMACDLMQNPIRDFIAEKQPDWIMADFFPHWAADIAQEFNIPLVDFLILSASSAVFMWVPDKVTEECQIREIRPTPQDLTLAPEWVDFPSQVAFRYHEAVDLYHILFGTDATGMSSCGRYMKTLRGSRAMAVRSCMEFEGDYFKLYSTLEQKPVFPLGFLPPEKLEPGRRTVKQEPWSGIFDWLDKQQPRSVVFVGFGSEFVLKKEHIYEIANGLELSGLPFLWALRKPHWVNDDTEALPPGFVSRMTGKGVVQIRWAPQSEILAHPSVGGSLFHAGWSSVVETMVYGHCQVLLPFTITQPLESRLLVGKGLGIEVKRAEDGSFTGNDIADALQKAMVSKEGEALRERTEKAAQEMFGNQQLNDEYIQKFVEYLKTGARQHK